MAGVEYIPLATATDANDDDGEDDIIVHQPQDFRSQSTPQSRPYFQDTEKVSDHREKSHSIGRRSGGSGGGVIGKRSTPGFLILTALFGLLLLGVTGFWKGDISSIEDNKHSVPIAYNADDHLSSGWWGSEAVSHQPIADKDSGLSQEIKQISEHGGVPPGNGKEPAGPEDPSFIGKDPSTAVVTEQDDESTAEEQEEVEEGKEILETEKTVWVQVVQEELDGDDPIISGAKPDPFSDTLRESCTNQLMNDMIDPAFWVVEHSSNLDYVIRPRKEDPSNVNSKGCKAFAIFSVRLIGPHSSLPLGPSRRAIAVESEIVKSLPTPVFDERSGNFQFSVPKDLTIPYKAYTIDVRLDFIYLKGGREGMVCGQGVEVCTLEAYEAYVKSTKPNQTKQNKETDWTSQGFIGQEIKVASGKIVNFGTLKLEEKEDWPLCKSYSPLPGYWSDLQFHPTPFTEPCSLYQPTSFLSDSPVLPPPFMPSRESPPIWLNFVGDSNTRNLFLRVIKSFGSGRAWHFETKDFEGHSGTVASVAIRARDGSLNSHSKGKLKNPEIIVTWVWWSQWAEKYDENADILVGRTNRTLEQFLNTLNLDQALKQQKNPLLRTLAKSMKPTRTYISLGSHSETLTALGTEKSLDILFGADNGNNRRDDSHGGTLTQSLMEEAGARFFTTTFVRSANIPLDRFSHQDLVRNNAVIHARNEVLRSRKELVVGGSRGGTTSRVLDVEGLTEGITPWYMKKRKDGKKDAVHFRDEVYLEWVKIVWSELAVGMERGWK